MNPLDWLNFVTELLRKDAEVIGGFFLGIMSTFAFIGLLRWAFPRIFSTPPKFSVEALQEAAAKAQSHQETLAALLTEKENRQQQLAEQILALHAEVKTAHERSFADRTEKERSAEETRALLDQERKKWRESLNQANENIRLANHQTLLQQKRRRESEHQLRESLSVLKEIEELQGRVWERPVSPGIPKFRSLEEGKPPIIALANLKGGVGKTSITANLAATYWAQGKRVLLVDLDHQSSLTSMCLSAEQLKENRVANGKTVRHLFDSRRDLPQAAWNNVIRIGNTNSFILACDEDLESAEEHAKASWLIKPDEGDVRYLLRAAFHHPLIQDQFDIILIDCPPRLTPSTINAVTCADYVLIPALLDRTSADAVPRLLRWLHHLKNLKVCPDIAVLGVLGNRSHYKDKLTKREANHVHEMNTFGTGAWGSSVSVFSRTVPNTPSMAEITGSIAKGIRDEGLSDAFTTIVNEIEQRRSVHESRRLVALA